MDAVTILSLKTRIGEIIKLDTTKNVVVPFDTLGKEMIEKMNRATRRSLLRGDILVISDIGLLLAVIIFLRESGFPSTRVKFIAHTKEVFGLAVWLGINSILAPYDKLHLFFGGDKDYNYVTADGSIMKFDVIIGNPPYNPPINARTGSAGSGSGNKIWQLFIERGFHLLREDGIMTMVTPNLWRGGNFTGDRRAHKAAQDILFEKGQTTAWSDCRSPVDHFPMVGHSISIDWWIWQKGKTGEHESLNRYRLLPRKMSDAKSLELWISTVDTAACHQNAFRRGRFPISFYDGGISKNQASGLHPYCMTGAKTRDGVFGWSSKRVNGVGVAKVIIHDSSGPAPLVDMKGQYGCGEHACAYSVCSAQDASDIVDFFNSNLFKWLTSQVAQEGSLGFPTPFFSRIPFSWRDLQRVICG